MFLTSKSSETAGNLGMVGKFQIFQVIVFVVKRMTFVVTLYFVKTEFEISMPTFFDKYATMW